MITKEMELTRTIELWLKINRAGDFELMQYTGCEVGHIETEKEVLEKYFLDGADTQTRMVACIIDGYYKQVRGIETTRFLEIAKPLADTDSRKNLITRTITSNVWKLYTFDENDNPVVKKLVTTENLSKRQVCKKYGCDNAKLVGEEKQLYGVSERTFWLESQVVTR